MDQILLTREFQGSSLGVEKGVNQGENARTDGATSLWCRCQGMRDVSMIKKKTGFFIKNLGAVLEAHIYKKTFV